MEQSQPEVVHEVAPVRPKKVRRRIKKPDLNTRVGKYFLAVKAGKPKGESALAAGFADKMHTTRIENTKSFQVLEQTYYKDELLKQITLHEIASEQIKNIRQDEDRGAKNKAIEMAISKLEPTESKGDEGDRVLIILK